MADPVLPSRYQAALGFLRIVIALVTMYGVGMVTAGRVFAARLFDMLGFGPSRLNEEGVDYSIFCFGVLGAVIVGWMTLMWSMTELASSGDSSTRSTARKGLAVSTAAWFCMDTGFSLAIGEVEHAAFNLPFVLFLAVPLYIMAKSDTAKSKSS